MKHLKMKPIHEKSSAVRTKLTEFLEKAATGKHIAIELNDTVVAWLGKSKISERKKGIPPIFLSAKEAKEEWSAILEAVITSGAYYGFRRKKDSIVVILVPDTQHSHKRVKEWQNHIIEHQASFGNGKDSVAEGIGNELQEIQDEIKKVHDAIKCVFRLVDKTVAPEREYKLA